MIASALISAAHDGAADVDEQQRELCHRFLDAIESGDLAEVEACYHSDATLWFNVTRGTMSVADNLAKLREGATIHRRRTYDDRIIDTFDDGFLARYAITVVRNDGSRLCLWAALVARTIEGRIVELYEYLDSGKFARPT